MIDERNLWEHLCTQVAWLPIQTLSYLAEKNGIAIPPRTGLPLHSRLCSELEKKWNLETKGNDIDLEAYRQKFPPLIHPRHKKEFERMLTAERSINPFLPSDITQTNLPTYMKHIGFSGGKRLPKLVWTSATTDKKIAESCQPDLYGQPIGSGAQGVVYTPYDDMCNRMCDHSCVIKSGEISPLDEKKYQLLEDILDSAEIRITPKIRAMYRDSADSTDSSTADSSNSTEKRKMYLVMDRILNGRSLQDYLQDTKIPLSHKTTTAKELLAKIQLMHKAGIIHRDLGNINNILVDGEGHPWMIDFGLSQIANTEELRLKAKRDFERDLNEINKHLASTLPSLLTHLS
jgi:hypothetical protein